MTDAAMDVWLDSAQYDGETLEALRDNLIQAFNLPATKAAVLVNGNSHRIKRSCTIKEAETLIKQFAAWDIDLRVEVIAAENLDSMNRSTSNTKTVKQAPLGSTLSLAPHGDPIPNIARDKTPPNVDTDHLHLLAE